MKFHSVFFLTLFTVIFFSCSKNQPVQIEEEEAPPIEAFIDGKILSKNAYLCLLGRDAKMHGVIKLSEGKDISVLEIDGKIDTKFIPDENQNFEEGDGENNEVKGREYAHVVYDNLDFWLERAVFALNCKNAVAIEKTFLYSDSDLSQKITTPQNPLKFAAIIALSLEASNSESENQKSVKIFYYDTKEKAVRQAFVSSDSISAREDDIVVSQIVESLKVTARAAPRNELFSKAAKYKPCKKVLAALNEQKVEKKTYNYQEVLKSVQRMSFGVNVDELMTVDQSKDPFK